jgi:hypothetical protein
VRLSDERDEMGIQSVQVEPFSHVSRATVHGAGRARDKSARGAERLVGRSAAGAAVGVAEIQAVVWGSSMTEDNPINPMNQADPRNQASPMNRGAADVPFQPVR